MRKEGQRLLTKNGYSPRMDDSENAQWEILQCLHQSFHLGVESTYQMASY